MTYLRDFLTILLAAPWLFVAWWLDKNQKGPLHPDWIRETRDACAAAGVAFWNVDDEFLEMPEGWAQC